MNVKYLKTRFVTNKDSKEFCHRIMKLLKTSFMMNVFISMKLYGSL